MPKVKKGDSFSFSKLLKNLSVPFSLLVTTLIKKSKIFIPSRAKKDTLEIHNLE